MDDLEKEFEYLIKIDEEFKNIILDHFNGLFIRGHSSSGMDFHAHIAKENRYFENTDYYYNGEDIFFHLTSIPNLLSILNSRSFRLYNLHSSNDPYEYKYAADILRLNADEIEHNKKYLYTFSFCPISELSNTKVWATYGNNFEGAAIVFKFENNPLEWINYHISSVKYETGENFNNYFKKVKEFEEKYSITAKCDLSKLMAFHKKPKWADEKEIRILTYYPFDNFEEYLKYSRLEFRLDPERNRITNYIDLPIWVDNDSCYVKSNLHPELDRTQDLPSDYFISRPKIRIVKIFLGENCGIQPPNYTMFRKEIEKLVMLNYGYTIDMDRNMFSLSN